MSCGPADVQGTGANSDKDARSSRPSKVPGLPVCRSPTSQPIVTPANRAPTAPLPFINRRPARKPEAAFRIFPLVLLHGFPLPEKDVTPMD
jgi:hypothetical protein